MAMARKRQKHEAEWRETVRSKAASREIEKDLLQSQKVCEQLDSQLVMMRNILLLVNSLWGVKFATYGVFKVAEKVAKRNHN